MLLLYVIISVLENKCKFVAYSWLQISFMNTFFLKLLAYSLLFLFVTTYNQQTLYVLCSFIIIVCLIINVESFVI